MQVPFPEAQGACSLLDGHTMLQACCAPSVVSSSGSGEHLVRMGPRDVALLTGPTWKSALRAHCPAQAPSILAGRQAELADIVIRYEWIHRRAYRADVRPTRDILPQHFKIVSAGRPGDDDTALEPYWKLYGWVRAMHVLTRVPFRFLSQ